MAKIINSKIDRPKATGRWSFSTIWRGTHKWAYEVCASYAADIEGVFPPTAEGDECREIPNSITVSTVKASGTHETTLRLTRDGAERLRSALDLALEWDGR